MSNRAFRPEPDSEEYDRYNPYYNPASCGLKMIATIQEEGLSYEFNTIIIVEDIAEGDIYMAHDSGCSCPIPFEKCNGLADMVLIQCEQDFNCFIDCLEYKGKGFSYSQIRNVWRTIRVSLNEY